MSLENFVVNDKNLNESIGGGGCLCSPDRKATGCEGPFIIFPAAEVRTDAAVRVSSHHAVLSLKCAEAAVKKAQGEALSAGEDGPH